jgi:hypothetical protein
MRSVILPPLDELRIQAPIRGATFETAKRAKKCERLFQRSAAGETDAYLTPLVVLGLVVGPARQLPQSPSPFPGSQRKRRDEGRESLIRGTCGSRGGGREESAALLWSPPRLNGDSLSLARFLHAYDKHRVFVRFLRRPHVDHAEHFVSPERDGVAGPPSRYGRIELRRVSRCPVFESSL